ncbi:SMP-30/gluconolactonase/LRE family protein [Azohydromonas lata]|uniref:SMP-30/Gluconolactonase/LRE-like region domain-containing protein n=1 Tax=Azohydromonas lata TaxID=45677 RepID=A0ABU5IBD5_9BURK|nr:hypothetical protein [Azohydromonas lata]MDZ5455855.1 hypothetical protein [Azohydromonas lata]
MDEAGHLLVADPGMGYYRVLNHRADPVQVIRSLEGTSLTNLAFGGPQRRTLYCTESVPGSILRIRMDAAGLPCARPEQLPRVASGSKDCGLGAACWAPM